MDNNLALVVVLLIVLVVAAAAFFYMRKRQSERLRGAFGPEYSRAVSHSGDRRKAERELEQRQKRVEALHIKPLSVEDRQRFLTEWRRIQAQFVDAPDDAVIGADRLVQDLMTVRGYPVTDFDQRAADLSVDHPVVVQNYRAAHDIALKHNRGQATTEDLRQAMIHYRALYEELLAGVAPQPVHPSDKPSKEDFHGHRDAAE